MIDGLPVLMVAAGMVVAVVAMVPVEGWHVHAERVPVVQTAFSGPAAYTLVVEHERLAGVAHVVERAVTADDDVEEAPVRAVVAVAVAAAVEVDAAVPAGYTVRSVLVRAEDVAAYSNLPGRCTWSDFARKCNHFAAVVE